MQDTYNYLIKQFDKSLLDLSPEHICEMYTQTKSDILIAVLFCKLYQITNSRILKFNLPDDDISTDVLLLIKKLMCAFDPNGNVKFVTYYMRCLNNLLLGLLKKANTLSRHCDEIVSIDNLNFDAMLDNTSDDMFGDIECLNLIDSYFEDEKIANIFKLLYQGYTVKQIAYIISDTNVSQIYYYIKRYSKILKGKVD